MRSTTIRDDAGQQAAPAWPRPGVLALRVWLLTLAVTAAGAVLALVADVGPAAAPHAVLHGTLGEAASIAAHNLRLLVVPLALAALGWGRWPITRFVGDAIVVVDLVVTPLLVGLALGRHGAELAPFVVHVPIEWAALSVAVAGWMSARSTTSSSSRTIAGYALVVVALTVVAALVETFALPHV